MASALQHSGAAASLELAISGRSTIHLGMSALRQKPDMEDASGRRLRYNDPRHGSTDRLSLPPNKITISSGRIV